MGAVGLRAVLIALPMEAFRAVDRVRVRGAGRLAGLSVIEQDQGLIHPDQIPALPTAKLLPHPIVSIR